MGDDDLEDDLDVGALALVDPERPLPRRDRPAAFDQSPEAVERRKAEARHIMENPAPRIARRPRDPDAPLLRRLDYVSAADLPDADEEFDDELIEGVIGRNAMGVIYGDSNTGKTFLAVEMAACIDLGADWLGRRTVQGLVLYLATEAAASVVRRLQARRRYFSTDPRVIVVTSPVNLFESDADVRAILAVVAEVEALYGEPITMIVADTLSRISAGANENAGQDMGVVLKHADAIRAATRSTFVWVHHCGKDAARGMRGWSGMRAAIDTEIEVTVDEATDTRTAEITKQRDLPGKGDRIGFRLEPVPLGVNRWGTERGTCVVVAADAPARVNKGKRPSEIAGAITEFLTERGTGCLRGAMAKHFEGRYVRQSVYKEVKKMVDAGLLIEVGGIVAMPGRPGVKA